MSEQRCRPYCCAAETVVRLLAGEVAQLRTQARAAPGDTLWIRETWAPVASGSIPGPVRYGIAYRADNSIRWDRGTTRVEYADGSRAGPLQFRGATRWRSPMHMRRMHSRLTVQVLVARSEPCVDGQDWIVSVRRTGPATVTPEPQSAP